METQPLRDPRDGAAPDSAPPYLSTSSSPASATASAASSSTAYSASGPGGGGQKKPTTWDEDSRFMCNICLDPVTQTVCTLCGHLYCWPCLYRVSACNDNDEIRFSFVSNVSLSYSG